jgi:hypothetical protein
VNQQQGLEYLLSMQQQQMSDVARYRQQQLMNQSQQHMLNAYGNAFGSLLGGGLGSAYIPPAPDPSPAAVMEGPVADPSWRFDTPARRDAAVFALVALGVWII